MVASAVIVRDISFLEGIDDSKKMTERQRQDACDEILAKCVVGIGVVEHDEIDRINILQASLKAMQEAVVKLDQTPDCLLIDGNKSPNIPIRQFEIIEGDSKSFAIACASIVAKVMRDRMMEYYDQVYPRYGFKKHKGYGTAEHLRALKENGPCKIHRTSFDPVKNYAKIL